MPLSTSVNSITGWPSAVLHRTMSPSPLDVRRWISLVNGSAARSRVLIPLKSPAASYRPSA